MGRNAALCRMWSACVALVATVAVHGESAAALQAGARYWTTAPDHRIDAPGRADGVFGEWSSMRIGASGTRVVVRDAEIVEASPVWRILVFSPGWEVVAAVAPEDIPEGFGHPRGVRAVADGFWTRHSKGSIRHSYDGGDIVETIRYPAAVDDLSPTPLDDGGFLGLGERPPRGLSGEPPAARAVLRLELTGDDWKRDTIGGLDIRRETLVVDVRAPSGRSGGWHHLVQPFPDTDLFWIDRGTESVGIVRRNGPPGVVEIVEISAAGDTLWRRRLTLPAVPLTTERAERAIEEVVASVRSAGERHGLTTAQVRDIVVDALHVPSHLPPIHAVVATASGEIWLATPQVVDGSVVWYSLRRSDNDSPPRRVLLPSTFRLQDAFGDHVWGFSEEASGSRSVVGLRLVPPSG